MTNTTMMRRTSSTIPFGYKLSETNNEMLEPIESELEMLDKVLPLIKNKTLSLREGSLWLTHETGRAISHMGLKKIAEKRKLI
jgi:hypothetical protein